MGFPQPRVAAPPSAVWQAAAEGFLVACEPWLWDEDHPRPRAWLKARGLDEPTIRRAGLGSNPTDRWVSRAAWGLLPAFDSAGREQKLWLPRGIVIPWVIDGALWRLAIRRRNAHGPKYVAVDGSAGALYGADSLDRPSGAAPGRPAVLVEGVLDALAVQQEAGDLVTAVASGVTGARNLEWVTRLASCSAVLVALDADDMGDRHAAWWLHVLGPKARRWRPLVKDPAVMLESGLDLRAWVEAGLEASGIRR